MLQAHSSPLSVQDANWIRRRSAKAILESSILSLDSDAVSPNGKELVSYAS
jgi:hypothetical protein